ncbi:unnamed protein product [Meganyctiphanes norvegica]|uniref:Uncharacterized protein n=1 Tax=Meganyctiphanes norvegica TaxID=48144 RepID=A0AAV2SC61_MEGNR
MMLVSQLVIVGLVQSSVVLIHHGAAAHTLDWYEDDDLEGVRFNYKIKEDLAQDGHPIQVNPFTSSRWHVPSDSSSQSSALPPSGSQIGVALVPAFGVVQQPTVSRSESVSSSASKVADVNNLNQGLGFTFGEFPGFKRIFNTQNSISKYDSKYDSKEDKNSFHTVHKSISSSNPTMSVSIVRRVSSYEHAPMNHFNNFGISKSVSSSISGNFANTPAPLTSMFARKLEVKPVDVKELYDDDSAEKNALSVDSEEKVILTPTRSKFVPTLAFLKPVTVLRPVANLRYQLRQQLSSTSTSPIASSTQASVLPTYKPDYQVKDTVEEVKPTIIQVKSSDDDNEDGDEESEESKETVSHASTRSKQPAAESMFASLLKRQSKPLSRFRYQQFLSKEDY